MKYYVRPTVDGENFTAGKLYEIQRNRFAVLNDAKEEIIVRCDGVVSSRLHWRGKFERVSIPSAQEAMESAERAAAQAIRDLNKGSGWRITKDVGSEVNSDNYIQNSVIGGGIVSGNITVTSEAAITVNGKRYTEREIKNLEKYAEMHKRDCIAAEAVVDRLYDIFTDARNPDQLIALSRQAKIFSDAFLELQKIS
nr:MAG TPA: hypothetical protein [Caudoviricetes sp.]